MCFSVSVGDFIATGRLIASIVSSLRSSSTAEYKELVIELHNLERALHEIEHVECLDSQIVAITAVKVAALTCRYPLDEFALKLEKFDKFQFSGKASRVNVWKLKLEWGFTMEEEVQKFRAYLVAHVGSLNMRLTTLGLNTQMTLAKAAARGHCDIEDRLKVMESTLQDVQQRLGEQTAIAIDTQSRLEAFSTLFTATVLPAILQFARHVWVSNMRLMNVVIRQWDRQQSPSLAFQWLQAPVKFEDARGRILPIPSEYNLGKVHAIISDQFRTGPGHEKVSFREYDLYDTTNRIRWIDPDSDESLVPGTSITMAIRIGMYDFGLNSGCPSPGCKSNAFTDADDGGRRCSSCRVWHSITSEVPPHPFRTFKSRLRKAMTTANRDNVSSSFIEALKSMRTERMSYKYVRIHPNNTLPDYLNSTCLDAVDAASQSEENKCDQTAPSDSEYQHLVKDEIENIQEARAEKVGRTTSTHAGRVDEEISEISHSSRFEEIGMDSLLMLELARHLHNADIDIFFDRLSKQTTEQFLTTLEHSGCNHYERTGLSSQCIPAPRSVHHTTN